MTCSKRKTPSKHRCTCQTYMLKLAEGGPSPDPDAVEVRVAASQCKRQLKGVLIAVHEAVAYRAMSVQEQHPVQNKSMPLPAVRRDHVYSSHCALPSEI